MKLPSREQVEQVRRTYPPGSQVECILIDDPYSDIPPGTIGEVEGVDDAATIFVKWSNGVTLGAIFAVDLIRRMDQSET